MGSKAVPVLIRTLQHKPTRLGALVDDKLADHLPKILVRVLPSAQRAAQRREDAAAFVAELGPEAATAIPTLLGILSDPGVSEQLETEARRALLAMGEKLAPYVPEFIAYLNSNDGYIQRFGAELLARTGPKAHAALPTLLRVAERNDPWIKLSVADALWNIDRQTNAVLNLYLLCLQSTNAYSPELALVHLRKMGPAAQALGPKVQALVRSPEDQIRRAAQKTLLVIDASLFQATQQEINQNLPREVARLLRAIQSESYREHAWALETLWVLGPAAQPTVPALIEVLQEHGPRPPGGLASVALMNDRRSAALVLAEIGPEARAAVPALVERLGGRDQCLADYCRALGCIGPDAKAATPALERAMLHQNAGVRLAAATALTQISPERGSKVVAVLRGLQHDPEMATVWSTDLQGLVTKTGAKDFQSPECRYFRAAAAVPLWRLGWEAAPPVEAIVRELNTDRDMHDLDYVRLLGDIGPEAQPALETLRPYLDPDRFFRLRQAAALAIRKISPEEADKLGLPGVLVVP